MIIHEDNNAVVGHWRLGFFHDFLFVFRPMVVARFSTTSIFFVVHLSAWNALITHTHTYINYNCNDLVVFNFIFFSSGERARARSHFSHSIRFFSRRNGHYTSSYIKISRSIFNNH